MIATEERVGGMGKKVKGNKRYKFTVISHRDVMYNIGNMISSVIITLYSKKWLLDLPDHSL